MALDAHRASCPARLPLGGLFLLASALLSVPLAVYGLNSIVSTSLRQLAGPAAMVDFVAFYTGAHQLLTDPSHLYDRQAWTAVQAVLHQADQPVFEFFNPPHTAVLLAPLAMLPFGAAYVVWLVFNLGCLGAAGWLLAPRVPQRRWWWIWATSVPLFLPVQLGLFMGQMCFVLLLGFAVFVRLARGRAWGRTALALLPWTLKPHLLPALLLGLALSRRWRSLALLCALTGLLCGFAVWLAGPSLVRTYVDVVTGAGATVTEVPAGNNLAAGHGLLGLAQWWLGPGQMANGLAVVGSLGLATLVGWAWRGGLRADERHKLQLALLPLAATLISPHALAYDATLWLASAWLGLSFAAHAPRARPLMLGLVVLGWWAGNLAALPGPGALAPWAAFGALGCLAGLAWLYARWPTETVLGRANRAYVDQTSAHS